MKNTFRKLILVVIISSLFLPLLNGCLITTNKERDLNQVVANISVGNISENIYKKELILAYNSYGYFYKYYGYTDEEVYDYLLYQLELNAAKVLYSKLALTTAVLDRTQSYFAEAESGVSITTFDNVLRKKNYKGQSFTTVKLDSPSEDFLTEYEYYAAKYEILNNIDDLMDSVMDTNTSTESSSTTTYTERANPASTEVGNEYEVQYDSELSKISDKYLFEIKKINVDKNLGLDLTKYNTIYDINMAVYKTYIDKFDLNSMERRKALKKVLNQYKENYYLGEDEYIGGVFTVDRLLSLSAFKSDFKKQCDSYIIDKFENTIYNDEQRILRLSDSFYEGYETLYDAQEKSYTDGDEDTVGKSNYESALKDGTFQVYRYGDENVSNGCGYVLHTLIGFNATDLNSITKNQSKANITEDGKKDIVSKYLGKLKAKDLRDYWVNENYGTYNIDDGFTFYNFYTQTQNSLINKYNGTIEGATATTVKATNSDEYTTFTYSKITPTEMTFTDFYTNIVCPIMSFNTNLLTDNWDDLRSKGVITNSFDTTQLSEGVKLSTQEVYNLSEVTSTDASGNIILTDSVKSAFTDIIYAYSTDTNSLTTDYGSVYYSSIGTTSSNTEFYAACKKLVDAGVGSYTITQTSSGYEIMICSKVLTGFKKKYTKEEFDGLLDTKGSIPYEYLKDKYTTNAETTLNSAVSNLLTKCGGVVNEYKKTYKDLLEEDE